ncbi:unnamed protein product [Parascedosporium putredinis]|uniref:HIG1 domain-containing protein n=1 Tax=Parascedosporium putredinis TaxID=1442378 RepID=A0A9P1H9V4_9PEZI|nr:unnamed protein product [Parascedosporium putredinis]CAI8002066.1 unnamed protein product [Parascedosporium putredinis]
MKVVTKEEEAAHYKQVLTGGAVGGVVGLGIGAAALSLGTRRYHTVRSLTLPFKAFLLSSSATFGLIVNAERYSIAFQKAKDPMYGYKSKSARTLEEAMANRSTYDKFMSWGRENRYTIVFSSWLASMGVALAIVNRSKYMTAAQKLVQARVYAQGLTVAVLVITAAFEMNDAKTGAGRWQTVLIVDPNDPEHKSSSRRRFTRRNTRAKTAGRPLTILPYIDMVAAEERRIAERKKQGEASAAPAATKTEAL